MKPSPTVQRASTTFFLDQGEFIGGAELFLIDFLNGLNAVEQEKIKPVVVGAKSKPYRSRLPKTDFLNFVYPPVRGNIFHKIRAIFRIMQAAMQLKKLAKRHGARQFFTNSPRTHFVMLVAKKLFRIKGRWVCMFHDFTTPKFVIRSMAGEADVLIANSMATRGHLRARIAERHYDKIQIVENGVDFTQLPRSKPAVVVKRVLCLGRLDPRKGQMYMLQAAKALNKTHPYLSFSIVGSAVKSDPNTVQYEKDLHYYVRSHDVSNVIFVPEVDNPFEVIQKHDLVCFLPTEPETFGRVVIEALALSKMVIAFDEIGPRETLLSFEKFINNPPVSLRVAKLDVGALVDRITYFCNNHEEIALFSSQARNFVQQQFNLIQTRKHLVGILT